MLFLTPTDYIKFWIKTLKHFTDGEHQKIFIVATHRDEAKPVCMTLVADRNKATQICFILDNHN